MRRRPELALIALIISGLIALAGCIGNAITDPYLDIWGRLIQGAGSIFVLSFVYLMTYMAVTEWRDR